MGRFTLNKYVRIHKFMGDRKTDDVAWSMILDLTFEDIGVKDVIIIIMHLSDMGWQRTEVC